MTVTASVVVAVRNAQQHYAPALAALGEQTLGRDRFEAVFVDDGSTDDTAALLRGDTAFHTWNTVLATGQEGGSGGPGRARNLGLDHATGDYVLFVDAHDRLPRTALARLVDRAETTGADIVVPRTAGHGRRAPRLATAQPLDRGHLTTHPVLMDALGAHMLFRRSFLERAGLRFPEGPVPLADRHFALRAQLAAESVAAVHDHTCYHLHKNPNPGPAPDPDALAGSLADLFELLWGSLPTGPALDRCVAHLHRTELLDRLDQRAARLGAEQLAAWHAALLPVAQRYVAPSAEALLPAAHRVRSAVLRAGHPEALRRLARHRAGIAAAASLEWTRWSSDGRLELGLTADLVHKDRNGRRTPVRFVADRGRYRLDLPADLLALPGVAEAADATADLAAVRLAPLWRHREQGTEVPVPAETRLSTVPLGRNAAGLPLVAVRAEAGCATDPAAADHGRPLRGLWDLHARLEACGDEPRVRIGAERNALVDGMLRPAFLPDGSFAGPYWTANNQLSMRAGGHAPNGVKDALREPDWSWAGEENGMLRLRIPLELGPLAAPVAVTAVLTAEGVTGTVRADGAVVPAGAPDLAALEVAVPTRPLAAAPRWAIALLRHGKPAKPAELGAVLHRHGPGSWTVA
ncbi:hypothetical protein BIV57_16690 [Mangrovactinospora gilvigrisea]|uniref:Glycosyltransferase 2-like domain-containing protein n=1 Tax=Mangrovactinospora gilvigrisea TaxID=1428644 RepID=A0A1J7BCG4_9ACTN|nr:glycosyltransferase family 2 protein [Mangrovactinospora gilvigrisea]OIV36363.1 hypothetical protein BIV57_16690 [Mangrovactinospora gilvigrisea]